MSDDPKSPFIHRDISWLSFNYRVLQEAKDPGVPLFERIKFLAIYSSNLDEFFRVRVANHKNLIRVSKKAKRQLYFDPKLILKEILRIVNRQQLEFSKIFENQIIPELRQHGVFLRRRLEVNSVQQTFIEAYFNENMLPFVQPVLLVANKIRPFLNNGALYLTVQMYDREDPKQLEQYALVKIPSDHLPRFIELPGNPAQNELIMLDDIVRHSVASMFPGYEILDTYSIKLTRDAELYIDDEFSGDLVLKIKNSLTKRHVGPPSRFVYDREMPEKLLTFLMTTFDLDQLELLKEGRYHDNSAFFSFPDFGLEHLKNNPLPPLPYPELEEAETIFDAIKEKDHLLYYPAHSYESVVQFFEQAAKDPKVTHIKITQYRVASKSRIMNALMAAVKAGKQVFAFVEVKARFDEEANIRWGEKLEAAGVQVSYSLPGLKVHSKLALINRIEEGGPQIYTYLSTGNFHENTSKIYCDHGLFTANAAITSEVSRVFAYLENIKTPNKPYEKLLVGQFNLREALIQKIEKEIHFAKAGKHAHIILKMNSLQDQIMIDKLYEASQAGVKIDLIIRGICCLVPGKRGYSTNINAISIVDRFLEHSRIFVFHNDGNREIYLSSADWMVRNLSYRIETAFPVLDRHCRKQIMDLLKMQLNDNVKSRLIHATKNNHYRKGDQDLASRSQIDIYYYYKRLLDQYNQKKMDAEELNNK